MAEGFLPGIPSVVDCHSDVVDGLAFLPFGNEREEVNINFNPGDDLANLRSQAEFKLVASRAAQAAVLKAEKANESTVDLEATKEKPSTSTDDTPTTPDGGGNTPSGGSGSSSVEQGDGDNAEL